MIELDLVTVIFMLEGVIALFLLLLLLFFFKRKNNNTGIAVSAKVIDKLQDTENIKLKTTHALLSAHCDFEPDELDSLVGDIKASERALYQAIIKIYLNNDGELLGKIDKQIDNLSEPYCKALSHSSGGGTEKKEQYEHELQRLEQEKKRLGEQLTIAMTTMDEISAEYTRVFSGTQTELELENSSKKMFDIFQRAGIKINATTEGEG